MARQLVVIGQPPSPLDRCLEELCRESGDVICQRIGWDSLVPERIRESNPELVLAVAAPVIPRALSFFQWLRETPVKTRTLAVVPDEVNGELLQIVDDFIVAPVRANELRQRILRILGDQPNTPNALDERLAQELAVAGLVGQDPRFLDTLRKIPIAARTSSPVLIVGETGTGKELCARAIHSLSARRNFPFIPVDCGAIPDHLFENELFGHVRGAFTDASHDQKGLAALAEGGTLFFDEIDSLSLSAQSKLLRFLQERTSRPLGSDKFVRINVNVVTATNHDLEKLVRERRFRPDLFFRLNVLRLYLVPLRERRGDLALLIRHFLAMLCAEHRTVGKSLTPLALRKLAQYEWPGNIRELYNVIQRAVVFSENAQTLAPDLLEIPEISHPGAPTHEDSFSQARSRAIEVFERRYVEERLRECEGNISRAARLAKKDRRAFGRLVKRYRITPDRV
jgi:two-component system response regulator GlrR